MPHCLNGATRILCGDEVRGHRNHTGPLVSQELGAAGVSRLRTYARTCDLLNGTEVDDQDYDVLFNCEVDDGEAVLGASIKHFYPEEVVIVTGDKRALMNIFDLLEKGQLRNSIVGNVIVLEQLLLRALRRDGANVVASKIAAAPMRFESRLRTFKQSGWTDGQALENDLIDRISALNQRCPGLLVPT